MTTRNKLPWLAGILLVAATLSFPACNKKDNPGAGRGKEDDKIISDDLAVFQKAICAIDEDGQLIHYNVGEALYESEPEHLFIGVDDIQEAADMFRNWIAPDVNLGDDVKQLTANLTDADGKPQGTLYFKAGSGTTVAEITCSSDTKLLYVDKITFLQNSAWPYNSGENKWHVGDFLDYSPTGKCGENLQDSDKNLSFVLLREAGNGKKPLWVAITRNKYRTMVIDDLLATDYSPGMNLTKEISKIVREDWDFFVERFNTAGCGKLYPDDSYIFDSYHTAYGILYQDLIILKNGYLWGYADDDHSYQALMIIDWFEDGKFPLKATSGTKGVRGENYPNLFDENGGSKWCVVGWDSCFDGSGKCKFVEFESFEAISPVGYSLKTANDTAERDGRNPKKWKLYGKKRGRDGWTLMDSRDNTNIAADQLPVKNYFAKQFKPMNGTTGEYQYFRLEFTETWGEEILQLSDFAFLF